MPAFFITGIDTGIGKSIITGLIAKFLLKNGESVITQKMVQTGCNNISEDILLHRRIMGIELTEEDKKGLTCPYIFKFPGSPHLAANLEAIKIDPLLIKSSVNKLLDKYKYVIIEGAGGLYVPLRLGYTILNYIQDCYYPTILVSSPKLGSINHTLLSLETAKERNINVKGIVYNLYPSENEMIVNDSKEVFKYYLEKFGYPKVVIEVPQFTDYSNIDIDFSSLFN